MKQNKCKNRQHKLHKRDGSCKKEMLAIKNTVTKRKDIFDGFIIRLDAAEERISGLGDISVEASKTEKAERAKTGKKKTTQQNRTSKDCERAKV